MPSHCADRHTSRGDCSQSRTREQPAQGREGQAVRRASQGPANWEGVGREGQVYH